MTGNNDIAIMESRMDNARLSDCASAVDHRGRREVVARETRCRRAKPRPAPANDDKQALDPVLDTLRHFRANPTNDKDATI